MLNHGVSPEDFCSTDDDRNLYSKFPRSKHHDMGWVLAFEEFVDEFVMANTLIQQYGIFPMVLRYALTAFRRSDVLYAFGLNVGNLQYNTVDDSAILVTVTQDLRVVVSASPTEPAVYIDVPLKNIQRTTIVSLWNAESQAHRYAVTMELSQAVANAWYHNAAGHTDVTMSIAFTSQSHAKTLNELLQQPRKAGMTGRPTLMESQPINCSEPALDDEFARPSLALTDSQRLARVALQANSLLGQKSSTEISHNDNAVLPSTSQDSITEHASDSDLEAKIHKTSQWPASSMVSAIEGIDVSQSDTANLEKTDSNIQDSTARADGPAIQTARVVGTLADEFEKSPGHNSEGIIQQDPPSKTQDQGYDSSYDISPRASKTQPKSTENAAPVIQPKLLHPQGRNRTLPASGEGLTEKPPSSKLSRSLRNNNRNVEDGIESPSSLRLERAAGDLTQHITTSKSSDNYEVATSAKSKVRFQPSQLTKKAKKNKDTGKALKGRDRENIEDEYDLPRSPEPPVRKLEASMIQGKATSQAPDRVSQQRQKPKNTVKAPVLPSSLPSRCLEAQSKPEHAPKGPPKKAVRPDKVCANKDAGNGSISDTGFENNKEDHRTSPKQKTKAKLVAKKPVKPSKEGKSYRVETQPKKTASQVSGESATKAKPAPHPTETRSKRAAAVTANKKTQGLEDSDEIVDEVEEPVSMSMRKPATTINKQDIPESLTEIPEEEALTNTEKGQASADGNAKNAMLSCEDKVPSSKTDEDANSEASSAEDVELISTTTRHSIAQAETTSKPSLPASTPGLSVAHGTSSSRDEEKGLADVNGNGDNHDRSPEAQMRGKESIPESITKGFDAVSDAGAESVIEPKLGMDKEVSPLEMVGDTEDSHFQEAMPDRESIDRPQNETMNDKTPDPGNQTAASPMEEEHSHLARKEVHGTKRATQNANQASINLEKRKITSGFSKARDPFEAKLSLLTSDNEATNSNAKERARPHTKQTVNASEEYNGGQHQFNEGEDVGSAGQINDSRRVTQPETQDDVGINQQQQNVSLNAKSGLNKKPRAQQRKQKEHGPKKQSVQAEQQQTAVHTQLQQAVSRPDSPKLAVPGVGNKRKAVDDRRAKEKLPKLALSNEQETPSHGKHEKLQQVMGNATSLPAKGKPIEAILAEMKLPDINRKPEMIRFSAGGPKNQGTASIKKPKPLKISTDMQADGNNQAAPGEEQEILKRKAASRVDDCALSTYEQPTKRQKRNITPPTQHKHVPQMIPEPISIAVHEKPQRVGSQSTRVDENGSPMPAVHAGNDKVADTQGYIRDDEIADACISADSNIDDEQCVSYAEGVGPRHDPVLPLTTIPPPSQGRTVGFDRLSSNSKQKHASPNAPSTFASIPVHYIFHDGTIVNPQTKENIVPTEPQDPFIGAGQVGTSDFMRALRRKSGTGARSQEDFLTEKKTVVNAKRRLPACTEDPDKTLVEGEPPRKQRKDDVISISSTITPSSSGSAASEGPSSSVEASSQESDVDTLAQWRKAFEPHQGNMLGVLSNISHVSKRQYAERTEDTDWLCSAS